MDCSPAAEDDPVTGNLLTLADDQEIRRTFITAERVDVGDKSFLSLQLLVLHIFSILFQIGTFVAFLT